MKTVTGLIMAGGRGTRMTLKEEKPLLVVGGKPLIEYVINALIKAEKISSTFVAVSDNTPKTANFLKKFPIKILKTPGEGYVSDLAYTINRLKLKNVLSIAADLPLITNNEIDEIVGHFYSCKKPALAVAVPFETKEKLGLTIGYDFMWYGKRVVFAGINVNDGSKFRSPELDQDIYVSDKPGIAININTLIELEIAKNFFYKILQK